MSTKDCIRKDASYLYPAHDVLLKAGSIDVISTGLKKADISKYAIRVDDIPNNVQDGILVAGYTVGYDGEVGINLSNKSSIDILIRKDIRPIALLRDSYN